MKPTPRLIRHRLAHAYRGVFSIGSLPMIVSGILVLSAALSVSFRFNAVLGIFGSVLIAALGLAYCVPWGVFTGPVSADEESLL